MNHNLGILIAISIIAFVAGISVAAIRAMRPKSGNALSFFQFTVVQAAFAITVFTLSLGMWRLVLLYR
jgi:hypothetical protein